MRIALITRDNGVGLSVDMGLLEGILSAAGHTVSRVDWRSSGIPRADVGIFLELWNPRLARCCEKTVGVFNLEWFQRGWIPYLKGITQLWAKSEEALDVYKRLGLGHSHLTGFTSRDMYDPTVPRKHSVLHLRGHSDFKNTQAVIEAWRRDPLLPPLTIISSVPLDVPPHVRLLRRLSDEQLRIELNTATIHLCPSKAEGWGHYITEALSVAGLVITTDASPMREHVQPGWGILIKPASTRPHGLVTAHGVSARQIREAVLQAAELHPSRRAAMGLAARAQFLHRNDQFRQTALSLIEELSHAPV